MSKAMTIKELYELAQAAGAEDYKLEVCHHYEDGVCYPIGFDYISHGAKVVVLTDNEWRIERSVNYDT